MFRQYAQQMGMQNVRAILPTQIDLLINNSISDTINQIITQNIGLTNDRVITDNSKLNQVNALRSLYKVSYLDISDDDDDMEGDYLSYKGDILEGDEEGLISDSNGYLFIVDMSLCYDKNGSITRIFPVRIIDDMYLADVLNDFILAPNFRSPVVSIYDNSFHIYIDDKKKLDSLGLKPSQIRTSYITKPAKVAYLADVRSDNVDCNLPDYMHVDIVKHAVELYRTAVTGSIAVTQQAQEAQQRENLRNNYRQGDNSNNQ